VEGAGAVAPCLPPGKYPITLKLALNGETYEDVRPGLTAYGAVISHATPLCGVLTGGTSVSLFPDAATAAVPSWFIASPDTFVRIYN